MTKKVLTPEQQAAKDAAKANVQAQKDARAAELNAPATDMAASIPLPVPSDKLLEEAEFARADYDALTYDEQKAFLVDWDAIDDEGNTVTAEYVNLPDTTGVDSDILQGETGNDEAGSNAADASTSTDATGSDGIVNRQGSEAGDAAVLDTNKDGKVTESMDTAGEDAGKVKGENEAILDSEAPALQRADELDAPRTEEGDAAMKYMGARDKRLPALSNMEAIDTFFVQLLDRLDAVEKKLDVLDREGEDAKAKISSISKKVYDKNTLHGSLDSLPKVL